MATTTYDIIESVTLSSSATSVTFSGISGSYGDLILTVAGNASSDSGCTFRANGDSGLNYSWVIMDGNGSSASSSKRDTGNPDSEAIIGRLNSGGGNTIAHFQDYSATDKYTTVLGRGNDASSGVRASAAMWLNTAAITSLEIRGNFGSGMVLSLYGVAK